MRIEVTADRDRAYLRHVIWHSARRARRVQVLLGAFLLAYAIPGITVGGIVATANGGIMLFGAILVATPLRWPSAIVRNVSEHQFGPHRYVLTDDRYEVSTPTHQHSVAWEEFDPAQETSRAYILWLHGRTGRFDLPKAALSAEQRAEFEAFLAGRRPRPKAERRTDTGPRSVRPAAPRA